jgi:hypothetical protein
VLVQDEGGDAMFGGAEESDFDSDSSSSGERKKKKKKKASGTNKYLPASNKAGPQTLNPKP